LSLPGNCPVLKDIDALPSQIDAVVVATPPKTYADLVPSLLTGKRHILLEKPLGVNLQESLQFTRIALAQGCVLMPALQRRFHPAYQRWPEWRDRLGTLIEAAVMLTIQHEGSGWRSSLETSGGGALFDLGFHAIDLIQQLFGDLRLHSACFFDAANAPDHGGLDVKADLLLETETFQPVRVQVERAAVEKRETVSLRGTGGLLEMSRAHLRFTDAAGTVTEETFEPDWRSAMEGQLHAWLERIRLCESDDAHAWDPLWMGASAMRLMEEAYSHGKF
jgi:predicted dehydrogenase